MELQVHHVPLDWLGQCGAIHNALYSNTRSKLQQTTQNAFRMLPKGLQNLLTDPQVQTIFVSPCSKTMADPLELLPTVDLNGKTSYAGLRKVFVRVHGLKEMREVLRRKVEGTERVVIGEPATSRPLPYAKAAAVSIGQMVGAQPILNVAATRHTVLQAIQNPDLGLLYFSGHGAFGAMLLADDEIGYADLRNIRWAKGAFVHWDCCLAGASWGEGGGRFSGLPPAAVRSGAAAVLASFHPLFDEPAKDFSLSLYQAMLDSKQPLPLGKALLCARNVVQEKYGVPLFWATSLLWGNPEILLRQTFAKV